MLRPFLIFGIVLATLFACNSNTKVSEMRSLPGYWDKSEKLTFDLPDMDSLKNYQMYFHIRNTNDYQYNNLFLIASIEFPHGKTIVDTLEYRMANPDGSWLGTGIGSVKESKLWYKENVKFYEKGSYTIELSHAMRNNGEVDGVSQLQGITDVGISIEEVIQE